MGGTCQSVYKTCMEKQKLIAYSWGWAVEVELPDQVVRIIIKLEYSSLISTNIVKDNYCFYNIHFINVILSI